MLRRRAVENPLTEQEAASSSQGASMVETPYFNHERWRTTYVRGSEAYLCFSTAQQKELCRLGHKNRDSARYTGRLDHCQWYRDATKRQKHCGNNLKLKAMQRHCVSYSGRIHRRDRISH